MDSMNNNKNRHCGDCNLCCILTDIQELDKPINTMCSSCSSDGCTIYETRPESCKAFECVWLSENWPIEFRPDLCHVMFETVPGCSTHVAIMEPGYNKAWLKENIQNRMMEIRDAGQGVVVRTGDNINILSPEGKDKNEVWMELKEAFRGLL